MNANAREMLPRAGSGLSALLTVVLVVLFFVPWVKVKCNGPMGRTTVAKATGWQLATGDVTNVQPPQISSGGWTQTSSQGPTADIDARPWFYLGLLIPLAGALLSALSFSGHLALGPAGKGLIVVGILGVVIAILAANVDYSDEMKLPPPKQTTPQASGDPGQALGNAMGEAMMQGIMKPATTQALVTVPTGAVWWSLALYVIVAVCGVINLVLPSMLRRSPSPEPPQPPQPAQPPPSPPTPDATDALDTSGTSNTSDKV